VVLFNSAPTAVSSSWGGSSNAAMAAAGEMDAGVGRAAGSGAALAPPKLKPPVGLVAGETGAFTGAGDALAPPKLNPPEGLAAGDADGDAAPPKLKPPEGLDASDGDAAPPKLKPPEGLDAAGEEAAGVAPKLNPPAAAGFKAATAGPPNLLPLTLPLFDFLGVTDKAVALWGVRIEAGDERRRRCAARSKTSWHAVSIICGRWNA